MVGPALADLLLVEGNPLTDLEVATTRSNFVVIGLTGASAKRADGT